MSLNELKNTSNNLSEDIKSALDSQIEYYKLYSFKIIAKSAAGLTTIFVMGLFLLTIVFFLSVAIAFAIGEWLGSIGLGFLIIGLVLSLLGGTIYAARKKLIHKPLLKRLSDIYYD